MERHEADEQLRKAIIDHAAVYGLNEDSDLLGDFVVIGAWVPQDYDEDRRTAYTTHLPDGFLPNHVALGLLEVARQHFLCADDGD